MAGIVSSLGNVSLLDDNICSFCIVMICQLYLSCCLHLWHDEVGLRSLTHLEVVFVLGYVRTLRQEKQMKRRRSILDFHIVDCCQVWRVFTQWDALVLSFQNPTVDTEHKFLEHNQHSITAMCF